MSARDQETLADLNDAIDSLFSAALHALASGRKELSVQIGSTANRVIAARDEILRTRKET